MTRTRASLIAVLCCLSFASLAAAEPPPQPSASPQPAAQPEGTATVEGPESDLEEAPFGNDAPGLAGRLAVAGNLELLWYLDTAHQAFARSPGLTAGGLSASLTLLEFAPRWLLDVGVGWRIETSEALTLQAFTAAYEANTEYADAALRFELLPWFVPRARVSVGVQYLAASLNPVDGTTPLEGDAFSLVTSAGVGVELLGRLGDGLTSRGGEPASVALSLVVEGGIVLGTSAPLSVAPREPSDPTVAADRIAVVGTKLGTLGGIAPYLRIAGVIRF